MKLTVGEHFPQESNMSGMMVARSPPIRVNFPCFADSFFYLDQKKRFIRVMPRNNIHELKTLKQPLKTAVNLDLRTPMEPLTDLIK